ncbi:hypothetical protein CDAR_370731 [Caerostris darwini]|uniref:Uncharacterized protein n=1 Tax=Caerostris darwini TaxID=1538125 RepID=A0AAV4VI34_9ARAC|nr:hypothetical protein CDAR_370731 [Caerostris darwini]
MYHTDFAVQKIWKDRCKAFLDGIKAIRWTLHLVQCLRLESFINSLNLYKRSSSFSWQGKITHGKQDRGGLPGKLTSRIAEDWA